jgi:hypothetical protein
MHPLPALIMANVANSDDHRRAQADSVVLESLLVQALAEVDRENFADLVRRFERVLTPWIVNFPAAPLVAYREAARRALRARAIMLFGPGGALLVAPPTEALPGGGSPGPSLLFGRR